MRHEFLAKRRQRVYPIDIDWGRRLLGILGPLVYMLLRCVRDVCWRLVHRGQRVLANHLSLIGQRWVIELQAQLIRRFEASRWLRVRAQVVYHLDAVDAIVITAALIRQVHWRLVTLRSVQALFIFEIFTGLLYVKWLIVFDISRALVSNNFCEFLFFCFHFLLRYIEIVVLVTGWGRGSDVNGGILYLAIPCKTQLYSSCNKSVYKKITNNNINNKKFANKKFYKNTNI